MSWHRRPVLAFAVLIAAAAPLALHTIGRATPALAGTAPATGCSQVYLPMPDPTCTPGAANPAVTQDTIGSTICVPGWTSTVRPPMSYTDKLKTQGIVAYGYSDRSIADYEEDHFLPLEVGGSPTDPHNLWPEPHAGANNSYTKDTVEDAVKRAVCAHQVTLAAAQEAMLTNWTTAESVLGIG